VLVCITWDWFHRSIPVLSISQQGAAPSPLVFAGAAPRRANMYAVCTYCSRMFLKQTEGYFEKFPFGACGYPTSGENSNFLKSPEGKACQIFLWMNFNEFFFKK
jgi:hypothetical protein